MGSCPACGWEDSVSSSVIGQRHKEAGFRVSKAGSCPFHPRFSKQPAEEEEHGRSEGLAVVGEPAATGLEAEDLRRGPRLCQPHAASVPTPP